MAIEVDGKIYRNLPEQVEENANNIEGIKARISELGTVMVYKGSVATYADLPTEGQKIGDFYNVLDTGDNYAWDGEAWDQVASSVDLSNLVDLDSSQTISGNKNFTGDLQKDGVDVATINQIEVIAITLSQAETNFTAEMLSVLNSNKILKVNGIVSGYANPVMFKTSEIGTDISGIMLCNQTIRSFRIRANGTDNTSISVDLPNIGKINGTDVSNIINGIFNIINVSDIVSNTLTQAQINTISNGKLTIINGVYDTISYPILLPPKDNGIYGWQGVVIGSNEMAIWEVSKTGPATLYIRRNYNSGAGIKLNRLSQINEKTIPSYPASTGTFNIQCVNGALAWTQPSGSTLVATGTFSNGEFTIDTSVTPITDGLYFFTYGNAQAFMFINSTMLANSGTSPIRTCMPVIYGANGETNAGMLRLSLSGTTLTVRVAVSGTQYARDGFTMSILKSNLM